jgi:segregation and condensation protein A
LAGHVGRVNSRRPWAVVSASNLFAVAYEVSTPVFEGPFDLLLHLISKEQVNLYEISLATIVDAFLVEIEKLQTLDLDVATEFLMIAATLVELKLRRLLPERANVEMDEELALLEERDLLLSKLLEYQTFRHAANALRNMETRALRSFPRTNVTEEQLADLTPDLLANVTPKQLRTAFLRAITRASIPKVEPKVTLDHVTDVRITVADAVNELAQDLPGLGRATFRSLTESKSTIEIVVRFLAVLELFKQGWIDVEQARNFGDLLLVWRPDGPDDNEPSLVVPLRDDLHSTTTDSDRAPNDTDGIDGPTFASMRALVDGAVDPDDEDAESDIDAALAAVQAQRLSQEPEVGESGTESGERGAVVVAGERKSNDDGSAPASRASVVITVDDYDG